ncbi:MAG: hypothetical protein RL702_2899 [Pseudomonadota bacterium]
MKMKMFVGRTEEEAMDMVRAEMGPDAVVLSVRDEEGRVLGPNQPGEIYVRGDQVSGQYRERSALDAEGWFPTRDAGYLDEDGYLFLSGRADDVIVRGGENISPGEIEDVVLTHPAIADAAAVAVPSVEWGEAVGSRRGRDPRPHPQPPALQPRAGNGAVLRRPALQRNGQAAAPRGQGDAGGLRQG